MCTGDYSTEMPEFVDHRHRYGVHGCQAGQLRQGSGRLSAGVVVGDELANVGDAVLDASGQPIVPGDSHDPVLRVEDVDTVGFVLVQSGHDLPGVVVPAQGPPGAAQPLLRRQPAGGVDGTHQTHSVPRRRVVEDFGAGFDLGDPPV